MNDKLVEKVVSEILDGAKDYHQEVRRTIIKAIPIIRKALYEEIENTKLPNAPSYHQFNRPTAYERTEGYKLAQQDLLKAILDKLKGE